MNRPVHTWRAVVQALALLVFLLLTIQGKNQIWMVIMLGSLVLTLLFGRFYCGWLCPIHAVMRPAERLSRRFNLQKSGIPGKIKSPWLRYSIFIIFLVILFVNIRGIAQLDVLLILILAGAVFTLFLPGYAWHRYICPFGVLFSIPARVSLFRFNIDREQCKQCGVCRQRCPGEAILVNGQEKHVLHPRHCLFCFECSDHCSRQAVKAGFRRG